MNFLILTGDNGYVASSLLKEDKRKIRELYLKDCLVNLGHKVDLIPISKMTFPTKYRGWFTIYLSSEDPGLFYKSFIEDVLLKLKMEGVILLPKFEWFRAHHDKCFMEMCRYSLPEKFRTLKAISFYPESINKISKRIKKYPVVLKTSSGAGGNGVRLIHNEKELIKFTNKMSKIHFSQYGYGVGKKIKHFMGLYYRKWTMAGCVEQAMAREKMIVQNFLQGLSGDYKVLVFGEKYYLLRRENRNNDFRASGSGKLTFINAMSKVEITVLDYAKEAYEEIVSPLLSIDIAYDGEKCHMIEFQCLNFGPYAIQYSDSYYKYTNNNWEIHYGKSVIEEEMANAYVLFANNFIKNERLKTNNEERNTMLQTK